jgi:hypothetical protein
MFSLNISWTGDVSKLGLQMQDRLCAEEASASLLNTEVGILLILPCSRRIVPAPDFTLHCHTPFVTSHISRQYL